MVPQGDREFDVVIFGATGYTGRYVIEELAKANETGNKKWAVAGRSREKLLTSLQSVQKYLDANIMDIPIIEADVGDSKSISEMCKRTKLILNCVGPYKLYGEVVVAACVENQTHHVDISGEIKYLETTQVKYFEKAEQNGIYIVQACGFDSIPGDLGIAELKNKFPGDLNSVEYYVELINGSEGIVLNTGTWLSAANSITDVLNTGYFEKLLKKLFSKDIPKSSFRIQRRFPVFFSNEVKGWCVPFIGPDVRVIKRSQMFCYQFLKERPVQFKPYFRFDSFLILLCHVLFLLLFGFLSLFSAGRYLLAKYPGLFSAGKFSKNGPSRKQVEESALKVTFYAEGWSEKLSNPAAQHLNKPDIKKKLIITGPDAAYMLTARCMVYSGLVILDENYKMPLNGGVLTPGAAFAKTTLATRLQKHGISFKYE